MTSNFALSLSFEGIRLMHRVPGGWHLVGEVALDGADLAADLAELRDKGLLLEPGGLRTKLLIPDSQIKYVTIDSAQTSDDDVMAALEGATPYALDDLVIDFDRTGGRTYIAAVARETLDEAEAFAADHAFAPLCFAAVPEPLTFRKEVFFGTSKAAADMPGSDDICADDEPVKIIGNAVFDSGDTGPKIPGFMAVASKTIDSKGDDRPTAEPKPAQDAPEPDDAPVEDVVFASRARSAPPSDDPDPIPDAEPEPPVDEPPTFARRTEPPELAVPTGVIDGPAIEVADDAAPLASKPITAQAPEPIVAPEVTGLPDGGDAPGFSSRRTPEIVVPVAASAPVRPQTIPPVTDEPIAAGRSQTSKPAPFEAPPKGRVGGKPRYLGLMLTAGLLVFLLLVALWANTLSDEGIAGWFKSSPDSDIAADDPGENLTVTAAPTVETLPLVVETPAPSALSPDPVVAEPTETTQPLPIVRAPAGRVLSPAEADRIYAATGVYQRAPRLPLIPRAATLDGFVTSNPLPLSVRPDQLEMPARDPMLPDAVIASLRNPPPADAVFQRDLRGFILATPDGTLTPDGVLVFAGTPQIEPPARPGSEVVAAPPSGSDRSLSPALNAEDGIILVAGRPPLVPPLRPEGLAPSSQEPLDDAAAPAPRPEGPASDARTETAEIPADPAANSDDTLEVVVGQPPITPPVRPAETPEPLEEVVSTASVLINPQGLVTPGGVELASFKPALRPASAANRPPLPAIQADPALAGYRPALRPEGLAPAGPEAPQEPDLTAIIAAIAEAAPPSAFENVTSRAIAASPRPDTRPRNFARVVANAQANIARQQQAAPAQPAAVVTRAAPAPSSGPVPGSVAQAATVENAIRLRDMNLIGVYGRPNARRALVRLGNGRYVKVEVGSSLDGGRVTVIGDSALNFVKRGQTYALQLPQG